MISRVAQTCFWMQRYLERADALVRSLEVNSHLVPDLDLPELQRWRPLLVVAGEESRFIELIGEEKVDDDDAVQEYLTWDERCPVSLWSNFKWARENARTAREIISPEVWGSINTFWLWLGSDEARRLFDEKPSDFYRRVRRMCMEVQGAQVGTMPVDEAMDFFHLGGHLERAGQTARMLDMLHHSLGATGLKQRTPIEAAQWLAILQTCSAEDAFFKVSRDSLTGAGVAQFLLLDGTFPRSVRFCVDRSVACLERIRGDVDSAFGRRTMSQMVAMKERLANTSIKAVLTSGLHDELTQIVTWVGDVSISIEQEYFQLTDVSADASVDMKPEAAAVDGAHP